MANLIYRYGVMGSSKTAQALMTKFNYEEKGYKVLLLKPAVDDRDGKTIVKSRVGISSEAIVVDANMNLFEYLFLHSNKFNVIIVDECQFLSKENVSALRNYVDEFNYDVICYGLRNDFLGNCFPGSESLFSLSDIVEEIPSLCECGGFAKFNIRVDSDGNMVSEGSQVEIGDLGRYLPVCAKCRYKYSLKNLPF